MIDGWKIFESNCCWYNDKQYQFTNLAFSSFVDIPIAKTKSLIETYKHISG